jgi:hypothetical protein
MIFLILMTTFVYLTPMFKHFNGEFPIYFYAVYFVLLVIGYILESTSWLTQMSFWAKTSDPTVAGTYLCLMAMLGNAGLL